MFHQDLACNSGGKNAIVKLRIMVRLKGYGLLLLLGVLSMRAQAQEWTDRIKLNQVGFYLAGPKLAVVENATPGAFHVRTVDDKQTVFKGNLGAPRKSEFSDKQLCVADFSGLKQEGSYELVVDGVGVSYAFDVQADVHRDVLRDATRGFYYQRASASLPEKYAGAWHRPAGHPDDHVLVHPSAAGSTRAVGAVISSRRGWYDAGDYNKYIVNSGITMGTLLSAYEDYPEIFNRLKMNIPESDNKIPDLLDEVLWNLRWMLTMQDPEDGGVYHKLTNARFDKFIMPDEARDTRYVVQKGTAAALDFAAVTAQASRVLKLFEAQMPGLADSCLIASRRAWGWALQHPAVVYNQEAMNKIYEPDIVTGAYGDKMFDDEVAWAASELYATTHERQYLDAFKALAVVKPVLPSWSQVRLLAYYTLVRQAKQLPGDAAPIVEGSKSAIEKFAQELVTGIDTRSFRTVMGGSASDFIWGSSAVAANQGIVMLQAYRITGDRKFIDHALTNLDYLLGRNGTGYCFLTGQGDKPPMHIHHRPSEADGIVDPVPGLLSGGPNPGKQDHCNYTTSVANEAFVDDVCSYASNEIAINWNAPLVYLVGGIEALQELAGYVHP
jgi:endoglucanase